MNDLISKIKLHPKYLNTEEAANFLRMSKGTLQNLRTMRQGPPYIKIGGAVRYDVNDLYLFMESKKVILE
jgi:hypothetical protein